jgi:hypothetical protein
VLAKVMSVNERALVPSLGDLSGQAHIVCLVQLGKRRWRVGVIDWKVACIR